MQTVTASRPERTREIASIVKRCVLPQPIYETLCADINVSAENFSLPEFYMAEFIEEVDGSRGMSRTEHALRSVLNCDLDAARARLIEAVERLDYKVITDEPLFARRRARGLGAYYLSANILEYPIKLTIGLRRLSSDATLATFDYVVEHTGGVSFKGDQQTLTREAEAIIALATAHTPLSGCGSCGTKQISEARFCRVCGEPTIRREPAELEVLRVTAGTRAGHHLIMVGAIWTALSFIAALVFVVLGFGSGLAMTLLLSQACVGLLILFGGIYQLSHTLSSTAAPSAIPTFEARNQLSDEDPVYLPEAPVSITEGTTDLLVQKMKGRDKETVYSKRRDTSPMD